MMHGLTLIPWQVSKNLVWDVTVLDTIANSYLTSTLCSNCWQCCLACRLAQRRKLRRCGQYAHFLTSGFRDLGPMCSKALAFSKEHGRRLTFTTDDKRETSVPISKVVCSYTKIQRGVVAEWIAHSAFSLMVVGSNPSGSG